MDKIFICDYCKLYANKICYGDRSVGDKCNCIILNTNKIKSMLYEIKSYKDQLHDLGIADFSSKIPEIIKGGSSK